MSKQKLIKKPTQSENEMHRNWNCFKARYIAKLKHAKQYDANWFRTKTYKKLDQAEAKEQPIPKFEPYHKNSINMERQSNKTKEMF